MDYAIPDEVMNRIGQVRRKGGLRCTVSLLAAACGGPFARRHHRASVQGLLFFRRFDAARFFGAAALTTERAASFTMAFC